MQFCKKVILVLRRFHSSNYFAMENILRPPRDIRGMKNLDKKLFEKIIKVPCIVVKMNDLKEVLRCIKPYLLKLQAVQSVRIKDNNAKEILLNPNIIQSHEDLEKRAGETLNNFRESISFEHVPITLTYDNWKASDVLNIIIPPELGSVSGYSLIGHIVHFNLKSELSEYKNIIGQVMLDKVPQAKTVVNKVDIIDNEFRTFDLEVLAGVNNFCVHVVENRCNYKFDFSKVYWNPRLSTEHQRIVEGLKEGDYLYDAFAGVGPFTIPAAKKGCNVIANDLNSEAIKYLKENLLLNKVKNSVTTSIKDAGLFIQEDFKNHFINLKPGDFKVAITMNLPALAPTFLPNFKGLFTPEYRVKLNDLPVPEVYVYCFVKDVSDSCLAAKKLISEHLSMNIENEIKSVSFVRKVAPNKDMMRVILNLTPKILISHKRCASSFQECDIKRSNAEFLSQEKEVKHEEK